MNRLVPADPATIAHLARRLTRATGVVERRRVMCVLARVALGCPAGQIAALLGWTTGTVHALHSRWARDGDAVFDVGGRGGRRRQLLSPDQEAAVLAPFAAMAKAGRPVIAAEVREDLELVVGRSVALSTVYRLLHRHGLAGRSGQA